MRFNKNSPVRFFTPLSLIYNSKHIVFLSALVFAVFLTAFAGEHVVQSNTGAFETKQSVQTSGIGLKHRLAIISIDNKTAYGQERIGAAVKDMLTTEISETGCFILVERDQLEKALNEQAQGLSDASDSNFAPRVGKLVGAEFVLYGSVTQFGVRTETSDGFFSDSKTQFADAAVDVRLMNVETGEIALSLNGAGHAHRKYTSVLGMGAHGGYDETLESEALRAALSGFAAKISAEAAKAPWMCFGIIRGEQIYMDAGSRAGIAPGQQYEIYSKGEAVYSPTTGAKLGYDETRTGTVQVDRLLGTDGGIAVLVSGKYPEKECILRRPQGK
jgi:curli biogenesis system outer membrane secretion channel CsgG